MQTLRTLAASPSSPRPPLTGCGGSGSSQPQTPTIQAARTFELAGFQPAAPVVPGKPTTLAFTIRQPNGQPLTRYHHGADRTTAST